MGGAPANKLIAGHGRGAREVRGGACRRGLAALVVGTLLMLGRPPLSLAQGSADDATSSALTLRGFGTFGAVRTRSDSAGFLRDLSQPKGTTTQWSAKHDSALGLQANWAASPTVEVVGQVVSHYRYDDSFKPGVSLAFVNWNPNSRTSLRVGRLGADFLMLADSRLVGYSYLPVRPSGDYFGQLFLSNFDGADVGLSFPTDEGILKGKLFAGKIGEKAPYSMGIWDTSGSTVGGAIMKYQQGAWLFRGSVAQIRFSHDHGFGGLADALRSVGAAYGYTSAIDAAERISARGTTSTFYSAGFVYDDGPLLVQGMINEIDHETGVFQNSSAAYVLAGYRLGSLTPYAGVSRVKSRYKAHTTGLPSGVGFDALIHGYADLMAATSLDQTTWRFGTRWDFRPNMALKVQWDAVRGSRDSRFMVTNASPDWNGRMDVFSLTLDFVF